MNTTLGIVITINVLSIALILMAAAVVRMDRLLRKSQAREKEWCKMVDDWVAISKHAKAQRDDYRAKWKETLELLELKSKGGGNG